MHEQRRSYPSELKEYGVVLESLDQIKSSGHYESKQVLYRLLDEAYRKGYKAAKEEQ